MAFQEHYKRSIVKAVTYRFIILLTDGVIIFGITGRYDTTVKVIILSNIASTLMYFGHERFWNQIHWGKSHKK